MREAMPELRLINERREEMAREAGTERLARSLKGGKGNNSGPASMFFRELKLDGLRLIKALGTSSKAGKRKSKS